MQNASIYVQNSVSRESQLLSKTNFQGLKMASSFLDIVLTSSPDGQITAYDPYSGSTLVKFNGSRTPRKGLTLIDKKLIAASHVSSDTGLGSVNLYNWWSSTPFHQLPMPEPVAPIVATRDGSYLFAGGVSGQIHSISIPSGDIILSVAAHTKAITCLEINPDGSLLLSGSDDGTISVFPIHQLVDSSSSKNSPLQRLIGHESSVTAITTGTGGCNGTIISCSLDCTCKFWSLMQKKPLYTVTFPCTIWEVKMDSLESEIYTAGSDGLVYKCALNTTSRNRMKQGLEFVTWKRQHDGAITSMVTINWGLNLVTASEDGNLCFWDVGRGETIRVLDQQQTGNISHLMAVTGQSHHHGGATVARMDENVAGFGRLDMRFSGNKKPYIPITEIMEMEEQLAVSVVDRKRAVDTLELAIGGYERLLKLILKEVQGGGSNSKQS
ncbi:hypothetical protein ACH5RR_037522 [Cinchona calisaya]|uniref:Uncharacterized protein n=1 Tax=Cinchona calisaya TaxID=153742 RepID=A0ABD2YBY2_9GENT